MLTQFEQFVEETINTIAHNFGIPRHALREPHEPYALQCCCAYPGCPLPGALRHQLTAYVDEESNWATLCFLHQREADEHWRERWDEYYAGLGV